MVEAAEEEGIFLYFCFAVRGKKAVKIRTGSERRDFYNYTAKRYTAKEAFICYLLFVYIFFIPFFTFIKKKINYIFKRNVQLVYNMFTTRFTTTSQLTQSKF